MRRYPQGGQQGFTLIELISIILLIGVISVVATTKWPGDMKEEAAAKEFKRAIRYAQHQAMTREYITTSNDAWGLEINGNAYSIKRQVSAENVPDFTNRFLLDNSSITITISPEITGLWFNGLGEPIDKDGAPLAAAIIYTIAGSEHLTVCPQTGYVREGATCS
ncbi:MAG: hypothetical protein RI601_10850 [Desulfurivibrionaceae bacterium]|nr:hypothetical protein [Desulfurivibrionaceae bacterium]